CRRRLAQTRVVARRHDALFRRPERIGREQPLDLAWALPMRGSDGAGLAVEVEPLRRFDRPAGDAEGAGCGILQDDEVAILRGGCDGLTHECAALRTEASRQTLHLPRCGAKAG